MAAQLVVGRDLLVRSIAFQVAFLSAAAVAARMGAAQLGAHQIGLQLWEFTALLLDAFAIGAQSLVGAALGGSNADVARALAWQVARWGGVAGTALALLIGAGWTLIPQAFSSDRAVLDQAHVVWPWFVGMLPIAGVVFALDGVLIGAGDVRFMALLTVVAGVMVFAPINVAAGVLHLGLGAVWAGLTAFVVARFVGMVLRVRGTRWLVLGATR
jgi:Na+-driven multidrug efflux pump